MSRSERQRKLLGLGRGSQPELAPVPDPEFPGQSRNLGPEGLRLTGPEIGLALVEPFVERELLGPVLGQVLEEVLPRPGAQEEEVGPDSGGPCLAGSQDDLPQLFGPVRDAWQDRRHPDELLLPGTTGEFLSEDCGDVRLHADRGSVAIVEGPVRAMLEMSDVTEGAPMDAAHVRVERPLEAHPLDRVQGALAGLFAILDP